MKIYVQERIAEDIENIYDNNDNDNGNNKTIHKRQENN